MIYVLSALSFLLAGTTVIFGFAAWRFAGHVFSLEEKLGRAIAALEERCVTLKKLMNHPIASDDPQVKKIVQVFVESYNDLVRVVDELQEVEIQQKDE